MLSDPYVRGEVLPAAQEDMSAGAGRCSLKRKKKPSAGSKIKLVRGFVTIALFVSKLAAKCTNAVFY